MAAVTASLADETRRWERETLEPALQQHPELQADFHTPSGTPLQRLYLPAEGSSPYLEKLGFPGEYPFTRGVQPSMYRGRLWTMRQYAGYATAQETNERYRFLLAQGQTGLSVAFDLPTQLGYDPDHPLAQGEVGRAGVSLFSLEEMEHLFHGIPLGHVSTSMTINAPAAILLAFYIAAAKRQGADPRSLRGTVQNDILKEYMARGTYIFPPAPSMRLTTDLLRYCKDHLPQWNTISVSGYHIREAGSTAVQEVAFALANAMAYLQAAQEAGLQVDEFAPQLTFFFNAHNDFLEEIAKFRAARRLWARLLRVRFGARDPRSWALRFHAQTGGSTLTAQQPENNAVRVTLQALAAVLGGAQSLHTNSLDEALGLPSQEAVQVALRTQQILAYESGVAHTIDPLGGSFAIEALTDEIETRAQAYLDKIDELGGALAALEQGFQQGEVQEAAFQTQMRIQAGEQVVVGVNAFASEEKTSVAPQAIDPALEARQRQRLEALRSRRDPLQAAELLGQVEAAARGSGPLMPLFIDCAEKEVTLGEICGALRQAWGEYHPG